MMETWPLAMTHREGEEQGMEDGRYDLDPHKMAMCWRYWARCVGLSGKGSGRLARKQAGIPASASVTVVILNNGTRKAD